MLIGLIKWFDNEKGFGAIATFDQGEFFIHKANFITWPGQLTPGMALSFRAKKDHARNRQSAVNCRPVTGRGDFSLILQTLHQDDTVSLERPKTNAGGRTRHSIQPRETYSIKTKAMDQLMKSTPIDTIQYFVTDYFHKELPDEHFITYCEFIERSIRKQLTASDYDPLLQDIYQHFHSQLTPAILFGCWKVKKFRFIAYPEDIDHEIPEQVLWDYRDEIGLAELARIAAYSYGPSFCETFAQETIAALEQAPNEAILAALPLLDYVPAAQRPSLQGKLSTLLVAGYKKGIQEHVRQHPVINSESIFGSYQALKDKITGINNQEKVLLDAEIDALVISHAADSLKTTLWLKGLIPTVEYPLAEAAFLSAYSDKRTAILRLSSTEDQARLIIALAGHTGYENTFSFLTSYFQNIFHDPQFNLSKQLSDDTFLSTRPEGHLLKVLLDIIMQRVAPAEQLHLFLAGWLPDFPREAALLNVATIDVYDFRKIVTHAAKDSAFLLDLAIARSKVVDFAAVFGLCLLVKAHLTPHHYALFDQHLHNSLTPQQYFSLWEMGQVSTFPQDHIASLLDGDYTNYKRIQRWLTDKIISQETITQFLLAYLQLEELVTDATQFKRQYNYIRYLCELDLSNTAPIQRLNNPLYDCMLWLLGVADTVPFDTLAAKFIYFPPQDQVKILRKLFALKASGQLDFSVQDLLKFTRFDADLYHAAQAFHPDLAIDVSTEIVITALVNYAQSRKFLVEGELLSIVLKSAMTDKKKKFELTEYFERCKGRTVSQFSRDTSCTITKEPFVNKEGENAFYFAITIPVHTTATVRDSFGLQELREFNPDFERLKEAAKKLPGRKWNAEKGHWGVPAQYEQVVLDFARSNGAYLDFGENKYVTNAHLYRFAITTPPEGIQFCEGRAANKPHAIHNKTFWWCAGQACFDKCETIHTTAEWEQYTLLDFLEILHIDTNEHNIIGDLVSRGHYYHFIGLVNRFNRLLSKIYCNDCDEILFPHDTGHFAAYNVVRFTCHNSGCKSHGIPVYLNHCLNGQCNSIIDSRISKKCTHGLYICDQCGSCCSHSMFERRLAGLRTVGGYIHPEMLHRVEHKLGHLGRAEYFCHNCGNEMEERDEDVFSCISCNVTYDTRRFKLKRPHRYLRGGL